MKTDLLKEAIADADAIKKLAIENAKASLNQAFDSKIKSMLAARLQEEADETEELEEEVEETDEAKKHSSEDEDSKEDSKEDAAEPEDVDEIDINKILAEMEDDEEGEPEMEEAKHKEEEEEESEEEGEEKETDEAHAEPDADNAGGKSDHDADNEEEKDEEVDLNALLKELEMEEGSYEEGEEEKEGTYEAKDEEDEKDMHAKMEKMKEEHAAEIAEIKSQAAKLAGKVNETNLINAKLLYLNKILHKHTLNEAQKVKVIAAFDKATTVKEAKIVFESLNEAFVVKTEKSKTNLKESLGFASKAAGNSTKREIITEADVQVARWQKLAGINKQIN
jgi:hypothetical protein